MTTKNLYRYENEDGTVTVTPNKRKKTDKPKLYRLIADEGKMLVKGDIRTECVDTYTTEEWTEETEDAE